MKKIFNVIGKIIFYIFLVLVFAWTASLTIAEVAIILPNDKIAPYFALALFDGGSLAWLMAWIGHAKGTPQRAISLVMLVIDLAGVALLSAGRLFMGGQTLTEAPENLGLYVVYGIAIVTICNVIAAYAFHIADPEIIEQIETGILEDTLREEAQEQARANIEAEARELGAILAARATGALKYRLRLPMAEREFNAVEPADLAEIEQVATPQIVPAILAKPKTRKVNPLVMFFAKTARDFRERIKPAAQQIITNESAVTNHLDGLTLKTRPADNSERTANEAPAQEPAQGDPNFTKPQAG